MSDGAARADVAAHRERMRVDWSDTDASGRIHNTAPLRWAERAEHSFLLDVGLTAQGNLLRRRIEVEYLGELTFGDEFVLHFMVERVGTSSLTYRWWADTDDGPVFTGSSVVVHIGPDGRSAPLPSALRNVMLTAQENQTNVREDH